MFFNSFNQENHKKRVKKPLQVSKFIFQQFTALIWPYLDYSFTSGNPQNDHTSVQMVSNERLQCLTIVLIKIMVLNELIEPLVASKHSFCNFQPYQLIELWFFLILVMFDEKGVSTSLSWAKINLQDLKQSNNIGDITINLDRMMNILPVVFRQICQLLTLNFSKGHTFLEILLPNLLPLWTLVLENMNLFSVQFRKGNNLSWGPCANVPTQKK